MGSEYRDAVKDALFPKKSGVISTRNKYLIVAPLKDLDADEIRRLRLSLSLSVAVFANLLGVSHKTVEAWEAGVSAPNGSALRLMSMLRKNPDFLFNYEIMIDKTMLR